MSSPDCVVTTSTENVDPTMTVAATIAGVSLTSGSVSVPALQATWSAVSNVYVTGFQFQFTNSATSTTYSSDSQSADRLSWTSTNGLVAGATYSVRYRAIGTGVVGPWSNWVSVTLPSTFTAGTAVSVTWAGVTGVGKPADNATVGATTGTNLISSGGYGSSGVLGDGNIVTPLGTSAAISGQGNQATATLTVSATAPASPHTYDIWMDLTRSPYKFKVYDGSAWRAGADVIYGSSLPGGYTPFEGDEWFNTSVTPNVLQRYTSGAWVTVASYGAKTGTSLYSGTYGTLTDTNVYTPLGTAAAITGQGSLALVNSIGWTSTYLTGKPQNVQNLIVTSNFDAGVGGWTNESTGGSVSTLALTGQAWLTGLQVTNVTGTGVVYVGENNAYLIPVVPGETIYFDGWIKTAGMTGSSSSIALFGVDKSYAFVMNIASTAVPGGQGWTHVTGSGVVPANTQWAQCILSHNSAGTAAAGSYSVFAAPVISRFQLGSDVTAAHTAAAIAGQGGLATLNNVQTGFAGTGGIYSSTYGWLNDSGIYTSIGTSAAITGQTSWATYGGYTPSQVTSPGANLIYNGGFSLVLDGWTTNLGAFSWGPASQVYLSLPYIACSTNSQLYSDVQVTAGLSYSLSGAVYAAGISSGVARLYVQWLDPTKATALGYGSILTVTGPNPWALVSGNSTPPTGTGYARIWLDTTNAAGTANTATFSGSAAWSQIKFEQNTGAGATPWNDASTNGALYSDRTSVNALRPAELGANVTGSHTAAAISGQGYFATVNQAPLTHITNSANTNFLTDSGTYGVITGLNTSAAFAGQTSWATFSLSTAVLTQNSRNLIYNPNYQQGSAGWTVGGGWAGFNNGTGDPNGPYLYGSGSAMPTTNYVVVASQLITNVTAGVSYSLQAKMFTGLLTGSSTYCRVSVVWQNSSGTTLGSDTLQTNVNASWTTYKRDAYNGGVLTSPTGTTQASIGVDIYNPSGNIAVNSSVYAITNIKFEVGSVCTPFADDSTPGALISKTWSSTYGFQSDGSLITNFGTAAAISGQGYLATTNNVTLQSGSGGLYSSTYGWLLEAGIYTSIGTSSAISGQGYFATVNQAPLTHITNSANTNFLTDSGTYGVITGLNTSAAFAGQTSWATFSLSTAVLTQNSRNLIYNPNYQQGSAGWTVGGGWAGFNNGTGDPNGPYLYGSGSAMPTTNYVVVASQLITNVTAGVSYSLQAKMFTGLLTGSSTYCRVSVVWQNSSGTTLGSDTLQTNVNASWTTYKRDAYNGGVLTSPTGTTQASIGVDIYNPSGNIAVNSSVYAITNIKFEVGSVCTPFADDSTPGALISKTWSSTYGFQSDGSLITNFGTAAAISGQGYLATTNNVTLQSGSGGLYSSTYGWLLEAGIYTSIGTSSAISGQGGLATANYYQQTTDPGSVPNGSFWADTSGSPTILLKLRFSGAWSTVANFVTAGTGGAASQVGTASVGTNYTGSWADSGAYASFSNISGAGFWTITAEFGDSGDIPTTSPTSRSITGTARIMEEKSGSTPVQVGTAATWNVNTTGGGNVMTPATLNFTGKASTYTGTVKLSVQFEQTTTTGTTGSITANISATWTPAG